MGGTDQMTLTTLAELRHLRELDPKLWGALSCPATGIEFDQRTLTLLDADGDGRIRPNPYIAIANQQMREIKSFAAEFGLTPSNRSAMIANVMSAMKENVDPMEAILISDDDVQVVGGSNFSEETE